MLEVKGKYILNDNIILRSINNKFWALNTSNGDQFKLNKVSFRVLSALNGRETITSIIDNIKSLYDVNPEIIKNDLLELLTEALNKNIIRKEE